VLADAIREVSSDGTGYSVSSRIVRAGDHLVPQMRERFVMAGVRSDTSGMLKDLDVPRWCLALPASEPVSLERALEGLPDPASVGDPGARQTRSTGCIHDLHASDAATSYNRWIGQGGTGITDSHVARAPRADDASFFALLGPGKRWMDYRCDSAETVHRLSRLISRLGAALDKEPRIADRLGVNAQEVRELAGMVDGSLSLRLILETIKPNPGEPRHHLLSDTYLRKREGNHGDWLARMEPSKPSKTIMSHMAKDTYAFVHPTRPRTLSVREAARIQTFPDDYKFGAACLTDAFRMIGNAVPPLLSVQIAERVRQILVATEFDNRAKVEGVKH
jgi:site-specific DNA-cytosine methylase